MSFARLACRPAADPQSSTTSTGKEKHRERGHYVPPWLVEGLARVLPITAVELESAARQAAAFISAAESTSTADVVQTVAAFSEDPRRDPERACPRHGRSAPNHRGVSDSILTVRAQSPSVVIPTALGASPLTSLRLNPLQAEQTTSDICPDRHTQSPVCAVLFVPQGAVAASGLKSAGSKSSEVRRRLTAGLSCFINPDAGASRPRRGRGARAAYALTVDSETGPQALSPAVV
jgi:hypothetical protein